MAQIASVLPRAGLVALLAAVPVAAAAQPLAPAGTGGIAALDHALRGLDQDKRVLMIAAHPDDENTDLITFLSRGAGADVAYLSLSRGEGGQNFIGTELGPALGLLRSQELLSSRTSTSPAPSTSGSRRRSPRGSDSGPATRRWRTWCASSAVSGRR